MVFDKIPEELQLPIVVLIGLIGFFIVIWLSGMSVHPESKAAADDNNDDDDDDAPSTPRRTPRVTRNTMGTINTPDGRRSARIARRRVRRED